MRLLIVIPSLKQGGAERVAATLSRDFAAAHETRVVVFHSAGIAYEFGGTLVDLDLKATRGVGKVLNGLRRAWAIRAQLKSFRPHLVISLTESANFPVAVAAVLSRYRARTYVSIRSNPKKFPRYLRLVGAAVYQLPVGIVACSAGVAKSAVRVYRIRGDRVRTIVNPVEVACCESAETLRQLSSSAFDRPYFVAVGRLDRQKGFDVLLSAWKVSGLPASHDLVVLGDGPLKDELTQSAASLGIGASVRFLGGVANPFPIVRTAEAFVLSSRFEGWPNALAEAMALGVPAISTDCQFGPAELIRNDDEGILVPVEDAAAMGQAMRELAADERRRRRLAAAAKARTAELSPHRIAEQWLALAAEA